jgi:hypothetical protein
MDWATLRSEIRDLLGDNKDSGVRAYSDPLLLGAFNRAMDHFAVSHTAEIADVTLTDVASWTIPAGFIQVAGVQNDTGEWLSRIQIFNSEYAGYVVASGQIRFPAGNLTGKLSYFKLYTHIVAEADVIAVPEWSIVGLAHLTIAYSLTPKAVEQAAFRRYQDQREAGQPEDNPMRKQAQFHMGIYKEHVGLVRPQDREEKLG